MFFCAATQQDQGDVYICWVERSETQQKVQSELPTIKGRGRLGRGMKPNKKYNLSSRQLEVEVGWVERSETQQKVQPTIDCFCHAGCYILEG